MPCDITPYDVYQCNWCECQFESGVAGLGPKREPRCPQCGGLDTRSIKDEEIGEFVVLRATSFG